MVPVNLRWRCFQGNVLGFLRGKRYIVAPRDLLLAKDGSRMAPYGLLKTDPGPM